MKHRWLVVVCGLVGVIAVAGVPAAVLPSDGSQAAPAASGNPTAILRKHFADVSALIVKSADLVPADKYGYRPTPAVRTFGQLVAHVIDSYGYYCGTGGEKVEWPDAKQAGAPDKAMLTRRLQEATRACTASTAPDVEALIGNIEHTNLHYGNMITYLRMLGLVPPSS